MSSSSILAARAISAFPVSVGTSLALESVFQGGGASIDPDRLIPQKIEISDYQEFWVNLSTLFRNLFSAVPSAEASMLQPRDCADQLLQEMDIIEALTREQSNQLTKPIFYICQYLTLDRRYPRAHLRGYSTDKKKHYKDLHDKTIQQVLARHAENDHAIRIFDVDLKPRGEDRLKKTALILTHVPLDLLSRQEFAKLDLLESHTGLLRQPNTWYAKYYQGKEMSMMPFQEKLLQVLGDNEMFHPFSISNRRQIVELAQTKKWTFATSEAKVMFDIETLKDKFLVETIKAL